jgi:DNA-directed RNA polymerase specialized sigma24 family protein
MSEKNQITPEQHKTIDKVCNKVKNKYSFAHFLPEDIYNEAYIMCIDGLTRYDGTAPLENFLSVHVSNRLKNFVRKHYSQGKQNLVNAIGFQNVDDTNESNMMYQHDDRFFLSKELENYIDEHLPAKLREDYLKFCENRVIIPTRRKLLKETLQSIMEEFYKNER